MEALKLKIFEVLTEEIAITEFEKWLYNSKYLKNKVASNTLIFEVLNINYRQENAMLEIKKLVQENFKKEEFLVLKIEKTCRQILKSNHYETIESYVWRIVKDYEFDEDYPVLWDFQNLYYSFDGYEYKTYMKGDLKPLKSKTKRLAETTLNLLDNCKSIGEKIKALSINITEENQVQKEEFSIENPKKTSFKQKILAFFKKY